MAKRKFIPVTLETKQQILMGMKTQLITCSSYNKLNEDERMFVEMIVMGSHTPAEAYSVIKPNVKNPNISARRLLSKKEVSDTIEELTQSIDKSFISTCMDGRNMAFEKLLYLMSASKDEATQVACAKILVENGTKILSQQKLKEQACGDGRNLIQFQIVVNKANVEPKYDPNDVIVVDVDPKKQDDQSIESELTPPGENGLNYVLNYQGVDNYNPEEANVVDSVDND